MHLIDAMVRYIKYLYITGISSQWILSLFFSLIGIHILINVHMYHSIKTAYQSWKQRFWPLRSTLFQGGVVLLLVTLLANVVFHNQSRKLALDLGGAKRVHSLSTVISAVLLLPWASFVSTSTEVTLLSVVNLFYSPWFYIYLAWTCCLPKSLSRPTSTEFYLAMLAHVNLHTIIDI